MRNDWFQPLRVVSFFIQDMKVFLKNIHSETLKQSIFFMRFLLAITVTVKRYPFFFSVIGSNKLQHRYGQVEKQSFSHTVCNAKKKKSVNCSREKTINNKNV